jgi:hypothetical protein
VSEGAAEDAVGDHRQYRLRPAFATGALAPCCGFVDALAVACRDCASPHDIEAPLHMNAEGPEGERRPHATELRDAERDFAEK